MTPKVPTVSGTWLFSAAAPALSVHFSVEELIILKILISVNLLWFFLELLAQSHFSQTAQLVLHSLIFESQECRERMKKACCISGLELKLSQRATSATLSSRAHQKKQSELNRYGPVLKDLLQVDRRWKPKSLIPSLFSPRS